LKRLKSKLLVPPVRSVFRPTVAALGDPLPSTQWTCAGLVHDRLLAVLQHLSAEGIPEVQSIVGGIQQLSAVHFEKEEKVLYPRLRLIEPQLLDQMDRQHELVREVETHVAEMLEDPPAAPDTRRLNELRSFGMEFHDHIQHGGRPLVPSG
jgi:hypothetical protein